MAKISIQKVDRLLNRVGCKRVGEFKNQAIPVKSVCNICKSEVKAYMVNVLKGKKPRCDCNPRGVVTKAQNEILRKNNFIPLEPYVGDVNKAWKLLCKNCYNEIRPTLNNLGKGQGCKWCSVGNKKYDYTVGRLYLLHNRSLEAVKIGISRDSNVRIRLYKDDWDVIRYIRVETGKYARKIERSILRKWRKNGLGIALKRNSIKHKGYTETANESGINIAKDLIDDLIKQGFAENIINLIE